MIFQAARILHPSTFLAIVGLGALQMLIRSRRGGPYSHPLALVPRLLWANAFNNKAAWARQDRELRF